MQHQNTRIDHLTEENVCLSGSNAELTKIVKDLNHSIQILKGIYKFTKLKVLVVLKLL